MDQPLNSLTLYSQNNSPCMLLSRIHPLPSGTRSIPRFRFPVGQSTHSYGMLWSDTMLPLSSGRIQPKSPRRRFCNRRGAVSRRSNSSSCLRRLNACGKTGSSPIQSLTDRNGSPASIVDAQSTEDSAFTFFLIDSTNVTDLRHAEIHVHSEFSSFDFIGTLLPPTATGRVRAYMFGCRSENSDLALGRTKNGSRVFADRFTHTTLLL